MAFALNGNGTFGPVFTCGASVVNLGRKAGEPMPIDNFITAVKHLFGRERSASRAERRSAVYTS